MKKFICLFFALLLLLCACEKRKPEEDFKTESTAADTVGVWITAFELNTMLKSEAGFENEFSAALDRLEKAKVNCLYVHVRAFADAYYPSSLFPAAKAMTEGTDPLGTMLTLAKQRGMRFFAWINPYRISTSTNDKSSVDEKIINAVGKSGVLTTDSGIYLDPADPACRRLVIEGVREVCENYDIDGIHFDDYFYPTADPAFDEASYSAYKQSAAAPLSLEDWRRANVNTLMLGTYSAVKAKGEDLIFSVSPAADIEANYSRLFADVSAWVRGGYVDEIIPQLYFGFEYPDENFRFDTLLDTWSEYLKGEKVRVLIGLPCYKKQQSTEADKAEWETYDDIIPRQIQCIKQKMPQAGYVYFSYSTLN